MIPMNLFSAPNVLWFDVYIWWNSHCYILTTQRNVLQNEVLLILVCFARKENKDDEDEGSCEDHDDGCHCERDEDDCDCKDHDCEHDDENECDCEDDDDDSECDDGSWTETLRGLIWWLWCPAVSPAETFIFE